MKSFLSLFVLLLIAQSSFGQYSNTSFINQRYTLFNVANTALDDNQINSSVGLMYNGRITSTLLFEHQLGKSNFALGGSSINHFWTNNNSNEVDLHSSYKIGLRKDRQLSFGIGFGYRNREIYFYSQFHNIKAMALRLGGTYKGERLKIGMESSTTYNSTFEQYFNNLQIFYGHKLVDKDNFDFSVLLLFNSTYSYNSLNLELEFLLKDSYEIITGKNNYRGYYLGFNYFVNDQVAINLSTNIPRNIPLSYSILGNDFQFGLQLKL